MDILHWWHQGDAVTQATALLLLAMSCASWAVIAWKAHFLLRASADLPRASAAFWQAAQWPQALAQMRSFDRQTLLLPLAQAAHSVQTQSSAQLAGQASRHQQLTRALRQALHQVLARLHWGQVLLATVGSTAPFVGLLGTVWGIFHALTTMAGGGAISIERLAGPVGEALIMTAAGLVVAIPAVLAYNWFGRSIGLLEADLEGFAHDVRELLAPSQSSTD